MLFQEYSLFKTLISVILILNIIGVRLNSFLFFRSKNLSAALLFDILDRQAGAGAKVLGEIGEGQVDDGADGGEKDVDHLHLSLAAIYGPEQGPNPNGDIDHEGHEAGRHRPFLLGGRHLVHGDDAPHKNVIQHF